MKEKEVSRSNDEVRPLLADVFGQMIQWREIQRSGKDKGRARV